MNGSTNQYQPVAAEMYEAGLCPIPIRGDGSKAPAVPWKALKDARYPKARLDFLFSKGAGVGVVCGASSGHLELIEFEGRAVANELWSEFVDGLDDDHPFFKAMEGYLARSPSGGLHVLFRTEGPAEPNTKLAVGGDGQVLIETRGQGGFVVMPPTNGSCHPSGKPWVLIDGGWDSIVTLTVAEREAIFDYARTFDAREPRPLEAPQPESRLSTRVSVVGGRTVDDPTPIEWINENFDPQPSIERLGWQVESRSGGDVNYTRPGKSTREGKSAVYHPDTRTLAIFSTAVDREYEGWGKMGDECLVLTPFDVWAIENGMPSVHDAVRAIRTTLMPRREAAPSIESYLPAAALDADGEARPVRRPLNLPPEFWDARPVLSHIRDAAWAETVSPDAVLGALLVRYAATVHPSIVLPGMGSLDLFVVCAGHSGAGKSKAARVARMLYPGDQVKVLLDQPIGSGEGLIEAFFRWVDEDGNPCSPQKKGAEKVLHYQGMHFTTDEGVALTAQAGRSGAIIIPTLCQAWFAETLGQRNASAERTRVIPPGRVRLTAQINIQMVNGWKLFSDDYAGTGLSQRMLCVSATDPALVGQEPEDLPDWPGPLTLPQPFITTGSHRTIEVPAHISREMKVRRIAAHAPDWGGDPLDVHADMAQLKVASIFALADDRFSISDEDWELATQILDSSRNVRSALLATKHEADHKAAQAATQATVNRHVAAVDAEHHALVQRTIEAVRRRIKTGKPLGKKHVSAPQRAVYEEAMEALEASGEVLWTDEGSGVAGWRPKGGS